MISSIHHSNSESLQTLSLCFFPWIYAPLMHLSSHYSPAFASHSVSSSCPPPSPSLGFPDPRLFSLHLALLHHPAQTRRVHTKQSTLLAHGVRGISSSHSIPFTLLSLTEGSPAPNFLFFNAIRLVTDSLQLGIYQAIFALSGQLWAPVLASLELLFCSDSEGTTAYLHPPICFLWDK